MYISSGAAASKMVVESHYPEPEIPEGVSLPQLILTATTKYGKRPALINPVTVQTVTYKDLVDNISKLADALRQRGVQKNDTIMIVTPNHVMYPVMLIASMWLGARVTTCNPSYTKGEIKYQRLQAKARYIFTTSSVLSKVIGDGNNQDPDIREIFLVDEAAQGSYMTLYELIEKGDVSFFPDVTYDVREHVALLPYSSGTTGMSKGIMLTHFNIVANLYQLISVGMDSGLDLEVYGVYLPLFHVFGMICVLLRGLHAGHTMVIMDTFQLPDYLHVLEKYKVTTVHITPPIAVLLAKEPIVAQYDLTSLRAIIVGAAPLGESIERDVMKATGAVVRQEFGMTELTSAIIVSPPGDSRPGSIGVPIRGVSLKVLSVNTNDEVGVGELGEICVKSQGATIGYLDNPTATENLFTKDGWMKTGDMGYHDADGHFYIVDRIKEVIKCQGLQVAPAEVEAVLLQCEGVVDSCVVGVLDDLCGEIPLAYVVLRPGADVTETHVEDFVAGQVAPHKALRGGVRFVESIPKSPSGKILRNILRDQARAVRG